LVPNKIWGVPDNAETHPVSFLLMNALMENHPPITGVRPTFKRIFNKISEDLYAEVQELEDDFNTCKNLLCSNSELNHNELYVAGLLCFYIFDIEMALRLLWLSIKGETPYKYYAFNAFLYACWEIWGDETIRELISFYGASQEKVLEVYKEKAARYLSVGRLQIFDAYVQRFNGNFFEPTFFFQIAHDVAVDQRNKGEYDSCLKNWEKEVKKQFTNETKKAALKNYKKWLKDKNKKQVAKHVARLTSENSTVVELGCHAGALLSLISQKTTAKLIGIEPDPEPVKLGKELHPEIEFILGNHEKLPEVSGDILLLSYICLLNSPQVVDYIFEQAQGKFKYIVLVDDIVNTPGEFAIPRRFYLMHPYKQILNKYGFEIDEMISLKRPTVAANAILVAKC